MTVCLAAKADGTKKPFIVFTAGKRECAALNEQFRDKCIIKSNVNGWMNEQLTEEWIDSVVGRFAFGRRLLSWDSFRCHISDSVRDKLWLQEVVQSILGTRRFLKQAVQSSGDREV